MGRVSSLLPLNFDGGLFHILQAPIQIGKKTQGEQTCEPVCQNSSALALKK
jgi:hypothetical protein